MSLHFSDNLQDNQGICNAFSRKGLLGMDVIKNVITFSKNDYRKLPKISPGAFIFQRLFLRGLFLEGLIFGGAYLQREIGVSKSIGLACSRTMFALFYFVFEGNFQVQAPRRVFCVTILGGLYLEGLIHGGAYFRNLRYFFIIPFSRAASLSSPASTFINQSDVTTT